jgi:ligand-binding SRPBCC domain-containing protein
MPVLQFAFEVEAPLEAVAAFHRDTRVLKKLTPPPIFVQLHQVEPLGEGSRSRFTMWFGPFPVHWTAVHTRVDRLHGFTDTQEKGPMAAWRHVHQFEAISPHRTRVRDHVEFTYRPGPAGWISRLLFHPIAMKFLFAYRAWATRRGVRRMAA